MIELAKQEAPQVPRVVATAENGYRESFNGKLRDELRNTGIFDTLREAQILIERGRDS